MPADQPITPADEQVLEPVEFPNGAQEISPRVEALIRYHKTGGHEGSGDVTLDEAQQALSYLTRPSPVVDGLAAELRATAKRYEDTMGLTREGAVRRIGVLHDALLDAADRCEAVLAMRRAPETTASEDVVEALRRAGRKLMPVEDAVPAAKEAQKIILAALANLPKPTEQATSPAPDAVLLREALTPTELADYIWRSDGAFDLDDIEAADPPPEPNWTAAHLVTLPIDDAPSTQDHSDNDLIEDYAALPADTAPPVVIIGGKLADGYHRLCAARRRGDATIKAYIAALASSTSPAPDTVLRECRAVFDKLVKASSGWDFDFAHNEAAAQIARIDATLASSKPTGCEEPRP